MIKINSDAPDLVRYTGIEYDDARAYWRAQLAGIEPVLLLQQGIRSRQGEQLGKQLSIAIRPLPEKAQDIVRRISGNKAAGAFTVILSAINYLMGVYCGQNQVNILTPPAGEEDAGPPTAARVLITQDLSGIRSAGDLLRSLQSILSKSYTFQDFPLELAGAAESDISSFTNVEVVYPGFHRPANDARPKDLRLILHEKAGEWQVGALYNETVFAKTFVESFVDHIGQVLQLYQDLNADLRTSSFLSADEMTKVLTLFNDTATPATSFNNIVELFEHQVSNTPSAIAVVHEGRSYPYSTINEKANQVAFYIISQTDVQPDDRIVILAERSERWIISMLGILKAGCAYVPVDVKHPSARIDYILRDTGSKMLFIDAANMMDIGEFAGPVMVMDLQLDYLEESTDNPGKEISGAQAAYIIYTSGSTGAPKGVVIEHKSMLNTITWRKNYYGFGEKDVFLQLFAPAFDGFVTDTFSSLVSGGKLVIPKEEQILDIAYLAGLTETFQVTHFIAVPAIYRLLLPELGLCKTALRAVTLAGEAVTERLVKQHYATLPSVSLYNEYGPSESAVCSTAGPLRPDEDTVTIGKPIANVNIYILDAALCPVPAGVSGEIVVAGTGVGRGYWNNEELTAAKFVDHVFQPRQKMYLTGDLGCWLPDGRIVYLGRKDHQIKIRGIRVEPGEIESQLLQHESVREAKVIAWQKEDGDNSLIAYISLRAEVPEANLKAFLAGRLPEQLLPARFIIVDRLPLTRSGKIDNKALSLPKDQEPAKTIVQPENKRQEELIRIWSELLGRKDFGIKDNFFDIGGHSLKAAQLISMLSRTMNVQIKIRAFFSDPTVEGLDTLIENSATTAHAPIIPLDPAAPHYELSHAQMRLYILQQSDPSMIAYNMPRAFFFERSLDKHLFEQAFLEIVRRHEILRTVFTHVNGDIRQWVNAPGKEDACYSYIDWRSYADSKAAAEEWMDKVANTMFDLEKGPLLTAGLLQTGDKHYFFFFSLHHIISDGISIDILLRELVLLYDSLIAGKPSPFLPLRIQYKDFAAWQNNLLSGGETAYHRDYWLDKLSGDIPLLDLPLDKPRQEHRTYEGFFHHFQLDPTLSQALKDFNKQQEVTLFVTFMSALKILFYKYSGQQDILIGGPVAGRDHPDLDGQLGLYLNNLVFRDTVRGTDGFLIFLHAVKHTVLDALEHQDYPYDLLLKDLNLSWPRNRNILYDVLLVMDNADEESVGKMEELTKDFFFPYARASAINYHTSKLDLSFFISDAQGISITIEYRSHLFEPDTIKKLARELEGLLKAITKEPSMTIQAMIDSFVENSDRHSHEQLKTHIGYRISEDFDS
ncbi:MAG TPA: amino acid adenylation domain-containing protein [Puia sp.]|nr:amino acid adenylation domain-containing protein [Puia sp.]